jgi:hypothetical protein
MFYAKYAPRLRIVKIGTRSAVTVESLEQLAEEIKHGEPAPLVAKVKAPRRRVG